MSIVPRSRWIKKTILADDFSYLAMATSNKMNELSWRCPEKISEFELSFSPESRAEFDGTEVEALKKICEDKNKIIELNKKREN